MYQMRWQYEAAFAVDDWVAVSATSPEIMDTYFGQHEN